MDLNQLLHHHQMALMAVSQGRHDGQAMPSFDLPRYYAKRINEYRERRGLSGDAEAIADLAIPSTDAVDAQGGLVGDVLIAELLMAKTFEKAKGQHPSGAVDGADGRPLDIRATLLAVGRDFYSSLGVEDGALAAAIDEAASRSAWEDEGGSLRPPADDEDGIIRTYVEQFAVGTYRYSNLVDAKASVRRQREAARVEAGQTPV
ncbi:hypothetical protein [Sphingopyxis sp. 22461]|uniref:hypothetical protein n=1 Tax=Sphingopyxis sp. 22461 TaxID=3453923 RepID=UPI003F82CE5C